MSDSVFKNGASSVSIPFNKWNDAQRVDVSDMNVEQDRNVKTDASIVNTHFGSGVIPRFIDEKVLFDSDDLTIEQSALVDSGDFDGTGIGVREQPSDPNLGCQLEVELIGADVSGRASSKVVIIGVDFQGNIQYDRFYFYKNEIQVTKKHYVKVLSILFNDFKGNNNCSRNRGGRVVVREVNSFYLSRDPVMVSQDVEPNLFFRDFKVSGLVTGPNPTTTLYLTLQEAIGPEYSVDALNIQTTVKKNRYLEPGDVTSKIGQKFKAYSTNIQKVTLLLGVEENIGADIDNKFDWSGELVFSIYPLQTSVSCPTSLVPDMAIDFDPARDPIVQLSIDQEDLYKMGYVLTDVLQPVDFVLSDTIVGAANNKKILKDRHYAIVIGRAGAANTGRVFTGVGNSTVDSSVLTLFSGTWIDVPEEDLWFQVWSDAAKIADGKGYDEGNGIQIDKTREDEYGSIVDHSLGLQAFVNTGENVLNTGVIEAIPVRYQEEQDERTGNAVFSRQVFSPSFSFLSTSALSSLKEVATPLIIGAAQDSNPKRNPVIGGTQSLPGLVRGDRFRVLEPNSDLITNNLVGSLIIPNINSSSFTYKISKTTLCTNRYGDVNGDGEIDGDDVSRASQLLGESLSSPATQLKIVSGEIDALEIIRADVDGDGTVTVNDVSLISQFVARSVNGFPAGTYFRYMTIYVQQRVGRFDSFHDCSGGNVRIDGTSNNMVPASFLTDREKEYYGVVEAPNINANDPVFDTVPFSPVDYSIIPLPWWQDYSLSFSSSARMVSTTLTYPSSGSSGGSDCDISSSVDCQDLSIKTPDFDPGRNDLFVPNNIIIGDGTVLNSRGEIFKFDIEVNNITLELPAKPLEERSINIFDKLVADSGDGYTSAGYKAMRFSDCTPVGKDALVKGQIKFAVAIQAFYPNLDGYSEDDGYGIIIDDIIGVYLNDESGILTLNIKDIDVGVYKTLVTKISITVFAKKAGWNNNNLVVPPEQIEGLLL